ncbi:hypothetical protein ACFSMW_10245 [Virgibacillus halophilus]|uniref:hypothetical protein n=1 Tax=Tigheibacillus halophilus TaxID=361280 RepID=UPI00362C36D0
MFLRDCVMYMAIFGIFSVTWFGWAQENPKKSWRKYLGLAAVAGLLVGSAGIYLSVVNWHEPTALADVSTYKSYLFFVYLEFFLAGIGALILIKRKKAAYVAPWVAFVVGIHFFWLKPIFADAALYILAIILILVSITSLWISKKLDVAASAITGIGAGTALFCFAILGLVRYLMI